MVDCSRPLLGPAPTPTVPRFDSRLTSPAAGFVNACSPVFPIRGEHLTVQGVVTNLSGPGALLVVWCNGSPDGVNFKLLRPVVVGFAPPCNATKPTGLEDTFMPERWPPG